MSRRQTRSSVRGSTEPVAAVGDLPARTPRRARAANALPQVARRDVTYGGDEGMALGEGLREGRGLMQDLNKAMSSEIGHPPRARSRSGGSHRSMVHDEPSAPVETSKLGGAVPRQAQPGTPLASAPAPSAAAAAAAPTSAARKLTLGVLLIILVMVGTLLGTFLAFHAVGLSKVGERDPEMVSTDRVWLKETFSTALGPVSQTQRQLEKRTQKLEQEVAIIKRQLHKRKGINFFSPYAGAYIIAGKTSPTKTEYTEPPFGLATFFSNRMVMQSLPPIVALQSFTELGECWCAATSAPKNAPSKAQLTVKMAFDVKPTSFIIEHINPDNAPNTQSAPKDIELWVRIPAEYLQYVRDTLDPTGEMEAERDATLSSDYMRILTAEFDPKRAVEHEISVPPIYGNDDGVQITTSEASVRAVTNHGASETCFYRFQLMGELLDDHAKTFGY